jgi:hypothetical protein
MTRQGQRLHPGRVLGGQPHADRGAQGQPEDVGPVDAGRLHERAHVVGEQLGGIGALRLAGQAGSAQVHREAPEVLGVLRDLERIARLVGREIRDEDDGLAVALHLVIDLYPVRLHGRHPWPSPVLRRLGPAAGCDLDQLCPPRVWAFRRPARIA